MRGLIIATAAAGALLAAPAAAQDATAGDLMVIGAMAPPHTQGRPTAAYMALANDGAEVERLVGARSPGFEAAELHESTEQDGVARMRPVAAVEIPPGGTVLLEPGGLHLMLFGAREAHRDGDEFPLVLIFEIAGEVEVPVVVSDMPTSRPGMESGERGTGHGMHDAD